MDEIVGFHLEQAARCLAEHQRLTRDGKPPRNQALFAVVQGAQYEDLRRQAARDLVSLMIDGSGFDGYGIGGALEKENLGAIVRWVCRELPENKGRGVINLEGRMVELLHAEMARRTVAISEAIAAV